MKTKFTTILFLIVGAFFISSSCYSQDLIILKNGDMIKSKVLQVSDSQIEYKKWDNLKGPIYSKSKSEVFMIKYQNGTKDVFKSSEPAVSSSNANNQTKEELKKKQAVSRLESYLGTKIQDPIKMTYFQKTNGEMRNYFGQTTYTINFNVTIEFLSDGWKKGNGLVGYWQNFYVYSTKPNLYASGQQYMYGLKLYPKGTELELGCEAQMVETDNGFEVKSLKIKTIQQFVEVYSNKATSSNQGSEGTAKQNKNSETEKEANPYYSEKDVSIVRGILDFSKIPATNKFYFVGNFTSGRKAKNRIKLEKSPKYDDIFFADIQMGKKNDVKVTFMYYQGILFYHGGNGLVIIRKIQHGIGYKYITLKPFSPEREIIYSRQL